MVAYGAKAPVFPNGDKYTRVTLNTLESWARNDTGEFDRASRVRFAALAKANQSGHATFGKGELREILAIDGRLPTTGQVSAAIRLAKARGAIRPESKARCLVVYEHQVSQGEGSSGCPSREHGR